MKKANRGKKQTEPSKAPLKEIPEIDFSKVQVRGNPYAERIAKQGIEVQVGRGRPRKLKEVGGTRPRSVRFPDAVWEEVDRCAKENGLTPHAAVREAVIAWLRKAS